MGRWSLRILLWHGYLLSGSGSNLYTANLARVWRSAGHDVLLMCQERHPERFPFIDAAGELGREDSSFTTGRLEARAASGSCTLVRPEIGPILPVYVYDEYEGMTAKRFVDLADDELDRYTELNVAALRTALRGFEPDAIVTGHEVMGPFIALEACRETGAAYVAKLHGSGLEYAVKEDARYVRFAADGLNGARAVTGGSRYMIREAADVIPGEWRTRAHVVNPGCDVELFRPLTAVKPEPPIVGYVGKLIAAKGVQHFLCALGLLDPPPSAVVVGYGGSERELRALWEALQRRDIPAIDAVVDAASGLNDVRDFVASDRADDRYFERTRAIDLEFTGRLEHEPLAQVLPRFAALVVPSVVPEAFGMVAAEAAACGVLPIVPRHSGIGEIGATLERELDAPGLLTFDPMSPIDGIAARLHAVLELDRDRRAALERRAAAVARDLWSWDHVADALLRHALPG